MSEEERKALGKGLALLEAQLEVGQQKRTALSEEQHPTAKANVPFDSADLLTQVRYAVQAMQLRASRP